MGRPAWHRRLGSVAWLLALLNLPACGDYAGPPVLRIPVLPAPPPIPTAEMAPLPAMFRITVTELRARTADGVEVDVARAEGIVRIPDPAAPPADGAEGDDALIYASTLRIVRPRVMLPAGTAEPPPPDRDGLFATVDFFGRLLGPRVRVDELVVEDGAVTALASPGRTSPRWWVSGVELRARDVVLGGRRGPEGFRIVRARGHGEIDGRPFAVASLDLLARWTRSTFVARGAARLERTRLRLDLQADRRNAWQAVVVADPLGVAELRAFVPSLPAEGTGSVEVRARGEPALAAVEVRHLDLTVGESRLFAQGTVLPGADVVVRDAVIEAAPVRAEDVERVLGVAIPGGGAVVGWVAADGGAERRIDVRGDFVHEAGGGALSRITIGGGVWLRPDPFVDLALTGSPLRAADTMFDVALMARGPLEAVSLRGDVAVRGVRTVAASFDGLLRIRPGARPILTGRIDVRGGGIYVEEAGLPIDSIRGTIWLDDGRLRTDRLGARVGGGTVVVAGTATVYGGPRRLDLDLHADSVRVRETEDEMADVTFSADLALAGPFAEPRLTGRVYDIHGWIREDYFEADETIDLDDPPYADLARAAPWPADSRLRRAEPDRPPPVRGMVVVDIGPDLRVIDEDSELYGAGRLRVFATDEGWETRGVLRIRGGFYAFFGKRFRVVGGAVRFEEDGFEPRIGLRAELEQERLLGGSLQQTSTAAERFPPLEFFAFGPPDEAREELYRWSLLPETQAQLGALLIYGDVPQPVTGWRNPRFWRDDEPSGLFGRRAQAQAVPLFWSWAADELYDIVPLNRGWILTGEVVVGSRWPARLVVGPVVGVGAAIGSDVEATVSRTFAGGVAPGFRVLWRLGPGGGVEVFSTPRFYASAIQGDVDPGFFTRRKNGVGVRWRWDFD